MFARARCIKQATVESSKIPVKSRQSINDRYPCEFKLSMSRSIDLSHEFLDVMELRFVLDALISINT